MLQRALEPTRPAATANRPWHWRGPLVRALREAGADHLIPLEVRRRQAIASDVILKRLQANCHD